MTKKRILVPIDFSAQQESVLAQAEVLAASMPAHLVLLHCIVSPEVSVVAVEPLYVPAAVMERFTRDHSVAVTTKMEALAEALRNKGISTEVAIKFLGPVQGIDEAAKEFRCDFIVMGSHGSGLDRFLLGSVAESVTRSAGCPVIVARDVEKTSHFRKLVIGIDFSKYSVPLVELARTLMHPEGELHLLHSWQPPHLDSAHLFGDPGHESLYATLNAGLQYHIRALEKFATDLPEEIRYQLHVEMGRPASVLLDTYESIGADAIVIGAHASDGVQDMLGTVSDRILRHADSTVLLTARALSL